MRAKADLLFSSKDLYDVLRYVEDLLKEEVDRLLENAVLQTGVDILAKEIADKYQIEVPILHEDKISVDDNETKLDMTHDFRYAPMPGHRAIVKGVEITFEIPFSGDQHIFQVQPNRFTSCPPRARVLQDRLVITFSTVDNDGDKIKNEFQRELASIRNYLEWVKNQTDPFNASLEEKVKGLIEQRKKRILSNKGMVASLGYALKRRDDAPKTYAAPIKRRERPIRRRSETTEPFEPEPELVQAQYEHIIQIITDMGLSIEKSPSAFASMGEEDLRHHFLLALNSHYEGNATGETFNLSGKTDIIIREQGKVIFISECKIWKGAKSCLEAVDQLLSYSCWRDTKTALILFNQNKNLTQVLEQIPQVLAEHSSYLKQVEFQSETGFRFILRHPKDEDKELTMTVLVFDVPKTK